MDGVGAVEAAGAVVAGIGHVSTRGRRGGGADLGPASATTGDHVVLVVTPGEGVGKENFGEHNSC